MIPFLIKNLVLVKPFKFNPDPRSNFWIIPDKAYSIDCSFDYLHYDSRRRANIFMLQNFYVSVSGTVKKINKVLKLFQLLI